MTQQEQLPGQPSLPVREWAAAGRLCLPLGDICTPVSPFSNVRPASQLAAAATVHVSNSSKLPRLGPLACTCRPGFHSLPLHCLLRRRLRRSLRAYPRVRMLVTVPPRLLLSPSKGLFNLKFGPLWSGLTCNNVPRTEMPTCGRPLRTSIPRDLQHFVSCVHNQHSDHICLP